MKKAIIVAGNYGSGKTELSLNMAVEFSQKGNTVLVDMDIDSCGLTYLFNLHLQDTRETSVQGWFNPRYPRMPIADDEEVEDATEHELFKKLFPVGDFFGFKPRAILCLPANPGEDMGNESNYDAAQSSNVNTFKKI